MVPKIRPITGRNEAHLDKDFGKPATRQVPVRPNELGQGGPPKFKQATCVVFRKKPKTTHLSKKAKQEIERRRQVAEVNGLKRQIEQGRLNVDPRLASLASNWLEKSEMWELY